MPVLAKLCELLKWIKLSKIKITFGKHEKFINWGRDDKIVKFGKGHGNKVDLMSELWISKIGNVQYLESFNLLCNNWDSRT